ncbi:formyltetrahydrofolate deformylase [Myxococcota bacterium]|nr:formyltetrahydrofolate deformylase [Myxococcota bacterium]
MAAGSNPDPSPIVTLLVSCVDRPGIVANLAQALHRGGANILDADQHTDSESGQFFQRISFDFSARAGDRSGLESAIAEVAATYEMRWGLHYRDRRKRIAIFVSRYDHCLYDLLLRERAGELDGEIVLIVSNHRDAESIAEQFGLPYHWIPVTPDNKAEQEAKQAAILEDAEIDLVVLARYMQILSGGFIDRFPSRIINIHHSFLPAFVGGRPYQQARERGVKLIGATAHYATTDLDEGPIIEQDVTRVSHRDSVEDLIRRGRDLERLVLARAVRWHLEDRVLPYGRKTIVFG